MKYAAAALLTACAFLLFASCLAGGTGGLPSGAAGSPRATGSQAYNTTDVKFLQAMVPHHEQGVRMARLARDRPVRPELRTLAAAIDTTQVSEIRAMAGWLRAWHRPPTAHPHGHAAHDMPVTSEARIEALARTRGPAFERAFLNLMIGHQDDAVQMARMELSTGADPRARDLARRIDQSRSAQIKLMLRFLGSG